MTKKFEIYKCEICGNVVEIVGEGAGQLVCCGKNMNKLCEQNDEEEMQEKHKPVITIEDQRVTIRVGKVPHPMISEHHIEFIEAISLDGKYLKRKYLDIDEAPELSCICSSNKMKARELCNIHGLWIDSLE